MKRNNFTESPSEVVGTRAKHGLWAPRGHARLGGFGIGGRNERRTRTSSRFVCFFRVSAIEPDKVDIVAAEGGGRLGEVVARSGKGMGDGEPRLAVRE